MSTYELDTSTVRQEAEVALRGAVLLWTFHYVNVDPVSGVVPPPEPRAALVRDAGYTFLTSTWQLYAGDFGDGLEWGWQIFNPSTPPATRFRQGFLTAPSSGASIVDVTVPGSAFLEVDITKQLDTGPSEDSLAITVVEDVAYRIGGTLGGVSGLLGLSGTSRSMETLSMYAKSEGIFEYDAVEGEDPETIDVSGFAEARFRPYFASGPWSDQEPDYDVYDAGPGECGWGYARVNAEGEASSFGTWHLRGEVTANVAPLRRVDIPEPSAQDVVIDNGPATETVTGGSTATVTRVYTVGNSGTFSAAISGQPPHSESQPAADIPGNNTGVSVLVAGANTYAKGPFRSESLRLSLPNVYTIEGAPFVVGGTGWGATSGATLTAVDGATALRIATSSGGAGGARHGGGYDIAYRYYRFRVRSIGAANVPVTVTWGQVSHVVLGSLVIDQNPQVWVVNTGAAGEWVEHTLDLWSGNNAYPDENPSAGLHFKSDELLVTAPASRTIEFSEFTGIRRHETRLTVLPISGNSLNNLGWIYALTDGLPSLNINKLEIGAGRIQDAVNAITSLNKSGWSVVNLIPGTGTGAVDDPLDSLKPLFYLQQYGLETCIDEPLVSGQITLYATSTGESGIAWGLGAGPVETPLGFDIETTINYQAMIGSRVIATVTNPQESNAEFEIEDLTDSSIIGTATPTAGGLVAPRSNYPLVYPGEGSRTFRGRLDPDAITVLASPPADPVTPGNKEIDVDVSSILGAIGTWVDSWWLGRFVAAPEIFDAPLVIDPARQWLHVGRGRIIHTYQMPVFTSVWSSEAHPHPWVRLAFDTRRSVLIGLALEDDTAYVYLSYNGGLSVEEILSVDASTSAIEKDSERGILILLYQDATSGLVKRRVSRDYAVKTTPTWDTATNILVAGSTLSGAIVDLTQDPRATGMLVATIKDSTGTRVIRSADLGLNWAVILT